MAGKPYKSPIPTKLRVGPHTVRVDATKNTSRLLRDDHLNGDSRADDLLIRIDIDRPHTTVADTLLHEAIHIVWTRTTALTCDHDHDTEERIVRALTPHLLALIRDNPALIAYLVK